MIQMNVTVNNKLGLHARVAGILVKCAQGFTCQAVAVKNGKRHSLKSIMDVMLLGCVFGEALTLEFDGPDEALAADTARQLFAERFGEAE